MKFHKNIILLIFTVFCGVTQSARILGLFPTFSRSHLIIHMSLVKTLFDRGHDITIATTLSLKEPATKFRHIKLDDPVLSDDFLSKTMNQSRNPLDIIKLTVNSIGSMLNYTSAAIQDPKMKKLIAEESFDLVIVGYFFNDFLIGVAGQFKCPIVLSWMNQPMKLLNDYIGNPSEALYVPHTFTKLIQPLDFKDRVKSFLFGTFEAVLVKVANYYMNQYYEENFPAAEFSFADMQKNVSLVFVNHHHISQGPIRPNVPGIIEIGGIQIKPKPDPLPEDIKKFLDSASKDGAIYFCLGSNVESIHMDPKLISTIFKILSSLKQKVVWKWETDKAPGKSPNILFKDWLPQDDILAHPNMKLFITHGGSGGVVEAKYHGVPMVGMPLFADQFANTKAMHLEGFGIDLGLSEDITEEKFRNAVNGVLQNPKYRDNIKRFSVLYKDRPLSARDTAAYWLEYVLRHRGAKHLQSPAVHMSTIEYLGLDVIAFFLIIFYIVIKISAFVLKKTICKLFKSKKNNVSSTKKRQ